MEIKFDIAATIAAIAWPVVLIVAFLTLRDRIPTLVEGVARRVKKLEVAGVSIELAIAKPFEPSWSEAPAGLDLRHTATAVQVNDSTAATFVSQLTDGGSADYAEVNLGAGNEWLTSRLFILSILYARVKGVKAFVFLETSGAARKRYVGWASPQAVRWALAKRYSWLESAYATAYA